MSQGWYFDDSHKRLALRLALHRWQHTPFCESAATVGQGVDCVSFAREIYRECGVNVASVDQLPSYSVFTGIHHKHTPLLAWLHDDPEVRSRFARIDETEEVLSGDLWAVRTGQGVHHVAIVGAEHAPRIWHVPVGGSVMGVDPEQFCRRARVVLRLRLRTEVKLCHS